MKTHLSGRFIRLAMAAPAIGRSVLFLAAHVFPHRKPNWALQRVAAELDCCVPVDAVLGNGMKIRVIWNDSVGAEIVERGYYELPVVRLVEELVKPGMVFIDAGAHVGQYTLLAADLGANVHSFEPDPRTFELLLYNVRINDLTNVRLNQCALAETCKSATLQVGSADNIGSASLTGPFGSRTSFSVQCCSLDSYLTEQSVGEVHLVKIDVEGAELHVLQGARGILSREPKPEIIIEFGEENQARFGLSCFQLVQFLTELGYELFRITESGLVTYVQQEREEGFFNVLARPSRRSSRVGGEE